MNNDMAMFSFHARIETFSQWPHTDCNCTPEKVKLFNISKYFLEEACHYTNKKWYKSKIALIFIIL